MRTSLEPAEPEASAVDDPRAAGVADRRTDPTNDVTVVGIDLHHLVRSQVPDPEAAVPGDDLRRDLDLARPDVRDEAAARGVDDRDARRRPNQGTYRFRACRTTTTAATAAATMTAAPAMTSFQLRRRASRADADPRRVERRVLTQDPPFELLQRPARLEAQLAT